MKAIIFVIALLVVFTGCTPQQSDQLTQQQKDQIKQEVKGVMDSIVARWQRLDVEGGVSLYSPEMIAINDNGIVDYPAYKKGWLELPNMISTVKWTTVKSEFVVLGKELAMSAISGKLDMTLKSGGAITYDPQCYSNVYKKFGNEWKIIYEHSSGTHVMQAAGKK